MWTPPRNARARATLPCWPTYSSKDQKAAGAAYTLLERTLVAKGTDGKEVKLPIKIGVIGFTTPAS